MCARWPDARAIGASQVTTVAPRASARATYAASYAVMLSPQLPHPRQSIQVGVSVKINVDEIRNRLGRAAR